ncbi:hypothetical protein HYH02_005626 [Chlamydomonas schloesseri]|uniref:Peptidase M11 gametolysin domain-containing protein n=1 Tax=Chlamydomonas schloesseri TaxID=2026947 RepID=A0A836B705_9CHLO|nr:hypothetical protein HYH02_005626 [Chlamydomonas schloesseri]|eukprot:KAG2449482.1 hypothetical protein HYH02_005626 [Chlamydomonas schloesseri]
MVVDCVLTSLDSQQCQSVTIIEYRVPAGRIDGDFLHKTLVVVTTACGFGGPQTSNVEKAYMKFRGHAYQMETCSFNKTNYDRSAFRVVRTAIPCSDELKRCRWEGGGIQDILTVANQAITNGRQRLEGGDANIAFNRYVILLPYGGHGCTWGGMGLTPGDTIWLPGRAFDRLGIVMQETLHNIGLLHGYGPDWRCGGNDVYPHCEYGDASTSMGIGDSCPSAPEQYRLGWSAPIADLNSANFPEDNRYRKYLLPATFTNDRNLIRIRPNWLGAAYTKNLYLALRQKGGGDWNLLEKYNNKVNVHTSSVPEDNADSALIDSSNTQPEIIATLAKNTAWTYGAARVAVRTGDFVDANNIEVFVCRFQSSSSDCRMP